MVRIILLCIGFILSTIIGPVSFASIDYRKEIIGGISITVGLIMFFSSLFFF